MAPDATPGSRKRGRPRKDQSSTASPAKRPRLASSTSTSKTTPGALRSLTSTTTKSFGNDQRNVSTSGSLRKDKASIDKLYEVPHSDDEQPEARTRSLVSASTAPTKRTNSDINGLYEFHGSDEESSPAQTPSRRSRTFTSLSSNKTATRSAQTTSPRVSGRGAGSNVSRTRSRKLNDGAEELEAPWDNRDRAEEITDSEDVLNTPSAMRTRPSNGATPQKTNGTAPKLKGILTPSRRLSERNPKSVAFDEANGKKGEMFFADLPNKAVKSRSTSQTRSSDKENKPIEDPDESETLEDEEDEEEDVACVICSKPESRAPNQILFCDGCDMAVHQKCYGVARIPKDDWLCNSCSQITSSAVPAAEAKTKASIKASETIPDIPNLAKHLRSLQRVLLDRCTGRRRIKLCGQDEAYEKTFQLVEQTVMAGEGNSMLIIGARGSGKTTVSDWKTTFSSTKTDKRI